jgi:hypothetical protein
MNMSTPPLLPPPPRSSNPSSRSNTPRPPDRDLLSSSPPRLAEPLFPISSSSNQGTNSSSQQDQGDTSFGSFTDATFTGHAGHPPHHGQIPFNSRKASHDPLNDGRRQIQDEHDLLGSFGDEAEPGPSTKSGAGLGAAQGMGMGLSLLSGSKLIPTAHPRETFTSNNIPLGQQDLLGEIDALLEAERPAQATLGSNAAQPSLSTSPLRSTNTTNPVTHPHAPPRRLSHFPSHSGPSSPPAISPISSYSFRGKSPTGDTAETEGLDDFGTWASASGSASGSGAGPSASGSISSRNDTPGAFRETVDRMRRLSFDREGKSSSSPETSRDARSTSGAGAQTVNLGRKPSWLGRTTGMVGSFPVKRQVSAGSNGNGEKTTSKASGFEEEGGADLGFTDEPGVYSDKTQPVPTRNQPSGQHPEGNAASSSTLLAEGTRRMTGLVHALGTLATKTASTKPKSKWRTVMGPSTFTPPTQGRSDPYFPSNHAGGSSSGSMGPDQHAGTWGRSSSGYMDDFMGVGQEMDRPTPTAQPIEITHHTPFNLNSSANQHSVYIPGTNTIIQPTGSYMPAPPSGAPGFRNEQVGVWQGDKSQRRDDWGGTKLVGRREGTFQVLDDHAADAVRNKAFSLSRRSIQADSWATCGYS